MSSCLCCTFLALSTPCTAELDTDVKDEVIQTPREGKSSIHCNESRFTEVFARNRPNPKAVSPESLDTKTQHSGKV